MLPPPIQQALAAEEGGMTPEVLMQQLAQMTEQSRLLVEELNAKNQIIETDQVKAQQTVQIETVKAQQAVQIEQLKAQNDERIAAMDNSTKLAIEEMKATMAQNTKILSEALVQIREGHAHGHEAAARQVERDYEREDRDAQMAQEREMADAERQQAGDLAVLDAQTKRDLAKSRTGADNAR
jgi:hypothetical protein